MPNRYDDRPVFTNSDDLYEKFFARRGKRWIRQVGTGRLSYPTAKQIKSLTRSQHVWSAGDRYYKLAFRYYGNPSYWWVIALFNKKPTEADLRVGDLLYIPLPLEAILRVYED
jgi:hypothetical protein|tara:strand:- start:196 stop:534 length:339 start_codon:yes stop_codon:yes gene_type:complete